MFSMNQNNILIALAIFFVWLIALEVRQYMLQKRLADIFKGKKAKDLESLMKNIADDLGVSGKKIADITGRIKELENFSPSTVQKIATIRFNPFKDTGGDQSFSVALLDGKNNGVVISSFYGREGSRTFAKPIEKGTSKYELLAEEKEAIKKATS